MAGLFGARLALAAVDYDEHVDAVERETAALAAAFGAAPLEARVPTCPDWSLRDLAEHVAQVTAFWTHILCEGMGRPKTPYAERALPSGARIRSSCWSSAGIVPCGGGVGSSRTSFS